MPNCFSLTRKGESEPATLSSIDTELCNLLGVPVHPKWYVEGWVDNIGFKLACGKSFADIRAGYVDRNSITDPDDLEYYDRQVKILDYLDSTYTSDAWAEIGRHR